MSDALDLIVEAEATLRRDIAPGGPDARYHALLAANALAMAQRELRRPSQDVTADVAAADRGDYHDADPARAPAGRCPPARLDRRPRHRRGARMSMDRFRLDGRVALVTGASGRAWRRVRAGPVRGRRTGGPGRAARGGRCRRWRRQLADAHAVAVGRDRSGQRPRRRGRGRGLGRRPGRSAGEQQRHRHPRRRAGPDRRGLGAGHGRQPGRGTADVGGGGRTAGRGWGRPGAIVNVASILGLRQGRGCRPMPRPRPR